MKNDLRPCDLYIKPTVSEQALKALLDAISKLDVHDLSEVLCACADQATALDEVAAEACIQDAIDLLQMPTGREGEDWWEAQEVLAEMSAGRKPE